MLKRVASEAPDAANGRGTGRGRGGRRGRQQSGHGGATDGASASISTSTPPASATTTRVRSRSTPPTVSAARPPQSAAAVSSHDLDMATGQPRVRAPAPGQVPPTAISIRSPGRIDAPGSASRRGRLFPNGASADGNANPRGQQTTQPTLPTPTRLERMEFALGDTDADSSPEPLRTTAVRFGAAIQSEQRLRERRGSGDLTSAGMMRVANQIAHYIALGCPAFRQEPVSFVPFSGEPCNKHSISCGTKEA